MSVHGSPTAQLRRGDAPCRPNFHERKQAELRARADEWHASPYALYMCARLSLNSGYSGDLVPMEGLAASLHDRYHHQRVRRAWRVCRVLSLE
ncbi:hypothetical protein VTO73DRAFT_5059 [Trametes versicolor]